MAGKRKRQDRGLLGALEGRYFSGPKGRAQLEQARAGASVARQILALRQEAGLTQRELAARIGTKHSVISRLESDDYEGHSLSMLRRIAAALGRRVEIRFVPAVGKPRSEGPARSAERSNRMGGPGFLTSRITLRSQTKSGAEPQGRPVR
jgi:transcriptional regulator with XRE-family HTH domain